MAHSTRCLNLVLWVCDIWLGNAAKSQCYRWRVPRNARLKRCVWFGLDWVQERRRWLMSPNYASPTPAMPKWLWVMSNNNHNNNNNQLIYQCPLRAICETHNRKLFFSIFSRALKWFGRQGSCSSSAAAWKFYHCEHIKIFLCFMTPLQSVWRMFLWTLSDKPTAVKIPNKPMYIFFLYSRVEDCWSEELRICTCTAACQCFLAESGERKNKSSKF